MFVRPAARILFFVLGLLFFLAVSFLPFGSGGLHGEGFLISFWGLALCAASILAEIAARTVSFLRQARGNPD